MWSSLELIPWSCLKLPVTTENPLLQGTINGFVGCKGHPVSKMLFGNVVVGEVHPQPHIWVFGNREKSDFYWWDPPILTVAPQVWRSSNFAASRCDFLLTVEHGSTVQWTVDPCFTVALFTWTMLVFFLKKKTSVVNLFHSHCSREHELLIFFCFLKKLV